MGSGSLLLAALNAAAFLLCVAFIAYVLVIIVPFLRRRPVAPADPDALDWHLILPCLDEELVVAGTVRRLLADHPSVHLWCVDDASADATPAVLARLAADAPRLHVVTRALPDARQGKGAALNAGWAALDRWLGPGVDRTRVIVGVVDADGVLDPRCFSLLAGPTLFGDPTVSAIQVQVRVAPYDGGVGPGRFRKVLVRLQDMEFRTVIAAMQTLRRHLGSVGLGGNGQFTRLSVLDRVAARHGTPWHGALLEDFELGLHILLAGGRNEYCHDTWVEQQGLPTLRRLVRQRSRWAQGSMQCLRYLGPVLRSRRVPTGGAIEVSYFLFLPWIQLIGGALYAGCGLVLGYYALVTPGGPGAWFAQGAWGIVPLFICFGLGPLVVWGPVYRRTSPTRLSRGRALALGLANWPYAVVHHAATWWAFLRILGARHDWKKTARVVARPFAAVWTASPRLARGVLRPPVGGGTSRPSPRLIAPGRLRPGTALLPDSHSHHWRNDEPQAA